TVDRRGVLAVNEKVMGSIKNKNAIKRMEARLTQWKAANQQAPAFLRADRRIRYGTVIQVMAHLRRMGIVNVGLMIERE
ncbi:MAG: biopolymer transporter ExbD, partial [bacterium]